MNARATNPRIGRNPREAAAAGPVSRVLIVDDDAQVRRALWWILQNDEFEVQECGSGMEALQILAAQRVDVVVTDVMMPGIDGLELLKRVKEQWREIEVIVVTAFGSIPDAVKATRLGAFDYMTKPFNEIEDCINKVRQAARIKRLHDENVALRQQVDAAPNSALLDTQSSVMKPVMNKVSQVTRVDCTVLLTGPTGAGKTVIARAIHDRSPRRGGPFIVVNCASIPSELIESAFFGHVKGAFTGAVSNKEGLFEMANGGTIFLDEIGDMHHELQASLLQILQEPVVRRVGDTKDIRVDVRVISATNTDLTEAIKQKRFREDLFFRLNVVEIRLPGLAQRRDDVPRLAYHFLRRHATRFGKEIGSITPRCMEFLRAHDWPGNVRQLENAIERAVIFETGPDLTERNLPKELMATGESAPIVGAFVGQVDLDRPWSSAKKSAEAAFAKNYLSGLMKQYRNVSAASRHAQLDRANFRRLLKRYAITDYPKGEVTGEG